MTVLDLIKRSMRLLGALNIGDLPTDDEAEDCFTALNAMTSAWALEKLMMYTSSRALYAVVAGQQAYALGRGAGADWVADRPTYLDAAGLVLTNTDPTQVLERPLVIIRTKEQWAQIRLKGETSTLPTRIYLQPDFPNAQVAFWPAPTQDNQVALYTPSAVPEFTSLTQIVSLPPGYSRAVPYNLAVEIAPEFDEVNLSPTVMRIADESKNKLKQSVVSFNLQPLACEASLIGSRGGFNWLDGVIE